MEVRKEAGKGEKENKSKSWGRNRFNSMQIVIYGGNKIQELFFTAFNVGKAIFSSKTSDFSCINFTSFYIVLHFPHILAVYPLQRVFQSKLYESLLGIT